MIASMSRIQKLTDNNSSNRTTIKRPMRLDQLEEMLLNSNFETKSVISPDNSNFQSGNGSSGSSGPNSVSGDSKSINNEDKNSGWSPFSTGLPSLMNIKPDETKSTPKRAEYNHIVREHPLTAPRKDIGLSKQPLFVEDLERLMLSDNNDSITETKDDNTKVPYSQFAKIFAPTQDSSLNKPERVQISNIKPHISFTQSNMPVGFTNRPPQVFAPVPSFSQRFSHPHVMMHHLGNQIPHQRAQHPQLNHYQHNRMRMPHHELRSPNHDEYAGLMTQKDKAWIITIHKKQLNFEDPFKEDFYFTSYSSRKLAKQSKSREGQASNKSLPALIVPERFRANKSPEYQPVFFEGSLGKIQISNVKRPRKLLDLDAQQTTEVVAALKTERPVTPIGRAELNALRRVLMEIERLYVIMLDIDEEDKRMAALPEESKSPHKERRAELCLQLFKGVYDEKYKNINLKIASIRKGFSLIVRVLLVLSDQKQKSAIATSLIEKNSQLVNSRKEKATSSHYPDDVILILDSLKDFV